MDATPLTVRVPPMLLDAFNAFVDDQREPVTRPEALRVIATKFLRSMGYLAK